MSKEKEKEKAIPTQEDYIAKQIEAKRTAALNKSRNRTSIKVPMIPNYETEEDWKRRIDKDIEKNEEILSRMMYELSKSKNLYSPHDIEQIQKRLDKLLEKKDKGYSTMIQSGNCMYNAGDCYGLNIPGNRTFVAKHKELGFKKAPIKNIEPGDIVQELSGGTPIHAMIYDSKDSQGNLLFNYARGIIGDDAFNMNVNYVKQGKYPLHIEDYGVYKYVGTPADSTQWINQYKQIYGFGKGGLIGIPYLKKGGIHIKKKNRGKFTEYCGGEVTDKCILKAKKSKNPKLRKRATFALNARGWSKKKQDGGTMFKTKFVNKRPVPGILTRKHKEGGEIVKFQSPAGGIKLVGSDRSPGIILMFKEWWNNYPTDYSDGMCALDAKGNPTNDCSKYSNDVLRSKGYKAIGDAWTRVPYSGAKVLYSGYDNNIPETFDQNTYWEYLNNTADKFASKVDTTKVRDYDIVGLTSAGSPSAERAYNEGKKHGRINTHTGHIRIGEDGTRYVIHNVHNNLYQHKLSDLLGSNKVFSAVEIARPKK